MSLSGFVSILLATYNGERFLDKQIESILDQTHGDFELLATDDGSSDATPAILERYAARDKRVRIVPSAGNRGQKQRLAELLPLARGAFVSIADQDDVWDGDKTALLLEGIGDAALAFGRSELVDEEEQPLGCTLLASLNVFPRDDDRLMALFQPAVSGHAMLARRETVTDAAFRRVHAYDWLIGLDAAFSDGWRYVDDAVVRHRLHGANQSNAAHLSRVGRGRRSLPVRVFREARKLASPRRGLWRANRRRAFAQRLEHLAASPVVPSENRRSFLRLWEACTADWYRARIVRTGDRHLRSLLTDLLKPHAGSPADWEGAIREIRRLA